MSERHISMARGLTKGLQPTAHEKANPIAMAIDVKTSGQH
jgi:hypothetical protein